MSSNNHKRARIGLLDHTGSSLGGAHLVVGHMAVALSRQYEVDIIHSGSVYTLERLALAFDLDLSRVRERLVGDLPASFNIPAAQTFFRQFLGNARALSRPYDLFVYSGHGVPPICYARTGFVYCHFPIESAPEGELRAENNWAKRSLVDRWVRGTAYRWVWRIRMSGYQRILANSSFTAGWVERRWGRPAEVLYPPVGFEVPETPKRNLIVSVARFTGTKRSKNQLAQVNAFREFLDRVPAGWSLCFVGSCGDQPEDQAYASAVRQAADGLPVTFRLNERREALRQVLGEAKIFWHTAGLSVEECEYPERVEHFGIATVEAMRAGCVPIVIAVGGQREIIEDGRSGFLSKDLAELRQHSVRVALEDETFRTMSARAKQRSMAFTGAIFEHRLMRIAAECLAP